ncbi:MAG: ABC transporter ATP-binding protein/permease [Rubellimicrobium sp.]|nr:ABC transporter ATP-binding protein/permease [Rubellimicrobium sp.]
MRRPAAADSSVPAHIEGRGRDTLRAVAPFLWPKGETGVKLRVIAALVFLALSKAVAIVTPVIFGWAVDALGGTVDSGARMLMLGAVGLTVAYGAARLLNVAFAQARDAVFSSVGQRALRKIALQTFRHIHRLSLRYHITRKTGGLSRVIERGVKGVDFLLRVLLFSVGPLILELLLTAAMLWWLLDVSYMLVVAVTVAVYIVFTFILTEWRVAIRREMNDRDTEANQKAVDSMLNFETVKYFNAEDREAARYDAAMAGYEVAANRTNTSLAALNLGQSAIISAALVAVMVMAALGVEKGTLTVGDFVMVNAYMIQITQPLNFLGSMYRDIRQALVDMAEMFDLLEQPPEVTDPPGGPALQVSRGEVVFDHVDFAYDPDRPILRDFSVTVLPGQTVAFVGPSGAGKSTIGRLLFRFYDVQAGAIRIDGQDVRAVTQTSLHAAIGVVPQDTVLFNDTIRYNIAYGRDDATDAEVESAARAAHVHDFVMGLPNGYATQVGERGLKLSGGEKQRVGIARTLLKNPPILILDEATSALDTATEREIQAELDAMGHGRSVIMIAHRLSTVAGADLICVLDGGRIVEQGRHDELLALGGRYAGLWARQAAEEAEKESEAA